MLLRRLHSTKVSRDDRDWNLFDTTNLADMGFSMLNRYKTAGSAASETFGG